MIYEGDRQTDKDILVVNARFYYTVYPKKLTNCVLAAARLEYMIARSTLWHSRQVARASVYATTAASKQPLLKCLLPNSFR